MTETQNRKCTRDLAVYSGSKSAAEAPARGIPYSSAITKAGIKN